MANFAERAVEGTSTLQSRILHSNPTPEYTRPNLMQAETRMGMSGLLSKIPGGIIHIYT